MQQYQIETLKNIAPELQQIADVIDQHLKPVGFETVNLMLGVDKTTGAPFVEARIVAPVRTTSGKSEN